MHGVNQQASLERAIRRSRDARAAIRRRRRASAALAALIATTLAGSGLWTLGALTGSDMVEAAVAKAQSLADLMGARSPGARSGGELTKTKHARALARTRSAPRPNIQGAAAPKIEMSQVAPLLQAPVLLPAAVDLQLPQPVPELGVAPPTLSAIVLPGSGPGSSPGGGSPPATFPGSEPKQPVLVPSAVPEPGTWATMLLGFGLIGWQLRRRVGKGVPAREA